MELSFGIEIEGVALRTRGSPFNLPADSGAQLQLIADILGKVGLSARPYIPTSTRSIGPDYSIWNVAMDGTISELTSGSDGDESAWRTRFGFELVSPVFHYLEAALWRQSITNGLDAVTEALAWKANRTTGLHVHVGKISGQWALDEVRKIAMFYCRFEGEYLCP